MRCHGRDVCRCNASLTAVQINETNMNSGLIHRPLSTAINLRSECRYETQTDEHRGEQQQCQNKEQISIEPFLPVKRPCLRVGHHQTQLQTNRQFVSNIMQYQSQINYT